MGAPESSTSPPRSSIWGSAVRERAARLRGRAVPTPLLAALVAVASWSVQFAPPSPGLDPSWRAGLFMAADQGLSYGTEIIWTYGPLGFLGSGGATLWFDGLAVATFLYASGLFVAFCFALVWPLRRALGALPAVVVAILAIELLPGVEQPLVIALAAALAVLVPDRHRFALDGLVVLGALFAALQTLIKLSIGPVVLAVFVVALIGARAGGRRLAMFGVIYVVGVLILWVLSGQDVGTLPQYVTTGREIISGYSEAMSVAIAPAWQVPVGALVVVAVVAAAALGSYRDGLARWGAVVIVAGAGFAIFKEGVVRFEANHATILFSSVTAFFLLLPLAGARRTVLAGGGLALVVVTQIVVPGGFSPSLDPVANVRVAGGQVRTLLTPSRREELGELGREFMRAAYRLDGATLSALEGQSVAVDPWEIGIAWAYDLEWSPLPVIQGYQDYTEELDRINAEEVAASDGPARILRVDPVEVVGEYPSRTIDGRYPAWDPPAQALATLCHFAPLRTTSRFQVLGRVDDRCGQPQSIGAVEAAAGEPVDVPEPGPGQVVFARIEGAGVEGLERLRTLLFRAEFRHATLEGSGTYRVVPGTAGDGLLLRGDEELTGRGPFAQAPQAPSISLQGGGDDLSFEFFRMTVSPAPAA